VRTGLWQRAAPIIHDGGWWLLLHKTIQKVGGSWLDFGRITFFKRDLGLDVPHPSAADGFAIRRAGAADLDRLSRQRHPERPAALLVERFRRGDLCFLAAGSDHALAHTRWVTSKGARVQELGLDLIVQPGWAYMYDGYTTPTYRGQGVDGAMRWFIFQSLRAEGCKAIYSYVRHDNPVAMRAAQRWQQRVGTLAYLRVGRFAPLVIGARRVDALRLVRPMLDGSDEPERASRAAVSRAWFEMWQRQPLAQRSTGCDVRPPEYFESTATFIAETLALEPRHDLVLDVGCDSAMVSRLVAKRCRVLVGVDHVAGMLADVPAQSMRTAGGHAVQFVVGDGRFLPFRSGVFTKVYCCAVLHVLPSRNDGFALIQELIRVSRPGGRVLVASVPDRRRRLVAWVDVFRRSRAMDKLKLLGSLAAPRSVRRIMRAWLGMAAPGYPIALHYDVTQLKRELERQGVGCDIVRFPADYWSRDFQTTRSNLSIQIPLNP